VNRATLERVERAFGGRFGEKPAALAWAPGRVNLIGEHTDYNDGFVLPFAIERGIAAVGRARSDRTTRLLAVDLGESAEVDLSRPEEFRRGAFPDRRGAFPDRRGAFPGPARGGGSWLGYAAGVLALLARRAGWSGGLEIAFGGDLTIGGGLSSSAALEAAVCLVGERLMGTRLEAASRAELCRRAEHEFAGVPCGLMDQWIVCHARPGQALLIDCRDGSSRNVPLPDPARACVLVIDSGVRHELAGGEYARRRASCESAARALGVPSLRDVDSEILRARGERLDPVLLKRARHVVEENARTVAAALALERGEVEEVGRLMNRSHDSLRDDFEVSCPELDTIVESARGVPGVFGARITGGGFGGCAVALVEPEAVGEVGGVVSRACERRHGRRVTVFETRAAAGAGGIEG
jgi:galactokinase